MKLLESLYIRDSGYLGYIARVCHGFSLYLTDADALGDLWSTGIILFMLLAGEPPFYSSHCDDWTMQKILNEPLDINSAEWDDISAECKDFVPAPQVLGLLVLQAF